MVINNPPTDPIAVAMIYRYWPIITAYGIVQKTNLLLARGSFFQPAVVIMVYLLLGYEHNLVGPTYQRGFTFDWVSSSKPVPGRGTTTRQVSVAPARSMQTTVP